MESMGPSNQNTTLPKINRVPPAGQPTGDFRPRPLSLIPKQPGIWEVELPRLDRECINRPGAQPVPPLTQSPKSQTGWSHIEWGAANYGASRVKDGIKFSPSQAQHSQLLSFITECVKNKGDCGTIYLNDYEVEATKAVASVVREFAKQQGWLNLQVSEVPGDYNIVPVPKTTTARISHPESSFFKSPQLLRRFSEKSETGLQIITHYHKKLQQMQAVAEGAEQLYKLGSKERYLFPSGREVKTDARDTRCYIYGKSKVSAVLALEYLAQTFLPEDTQLYSWGTERRCLRLLEGATTVRFTDTRFATLRARDRALLGPGAYCSLNPVGYAGHGKELLVFEFIAEQKFLGVQSTKLRRLDLDLQLLGYEKGINDKCWQQDLSALGYTGICCSEANSTSPTETLIFRGNKTILLHNGRSFLNRMSASEIAASPWGAQTVTAIKSLGETDKLGQLREECLNLNPEQIEALFFDMRTTYERIKPWFDSLVRSIIGGHKSGFSRWWKSLQGE
jgi:hypothetical protein